MNKQLRQRLAIGFTGLVMAATMVVGTVSVAAEGGELDEHAIASTPDATLTISSVAAPAAGQVLAIAGDDGRDDNQ